MPWFTCRLLDDIVRIPGRCKLKSILSTGATGPLATSCADALQHSSFFTNLRADKPLSHFRGGSVHMVIQQGLKYGRARYHA